MCSLKGFLHLIVGAADFEQTAGAELLTEYRFNTRVAVHRFCRVCGVHAFYTPRSHPDGVSVNVRCLDGADVRESFTVTPFHGREWEANVDEIR